MRYLSVCSGIEAASCAWHPLGWRPVAFSEIGAFPSAVLAERWPEVPNLGDMTQFHHWPNYESVDVLVGGTPCQSFSIAGLRGGLDDPRGNLALTFLSIVERNCPRWVVWENVPGVLSDESGAFASFLGGLAELGYGWAYRVLDAQYFGLAQRRRRVFVVAHSGGSWQRAASVLFERESLLWHPSPGGREPDDVAATLTAGPPKCDRGRNPGSLIVTDGSFAFKPSHYTRDKDGGPSDIYPPLSAEADKGDQEALIFQTRIARNGRGQLETLCPALTGADAGATSDMRPCLIAPPGVVRRVTPRECERLQGFADDYTRIEINGKIAADSPRYKALGNTMAVNVMSFIGRRIAMVNAL